MVKFVRNSIAVSQFTSSSIIVVHVVTTATTTKKSNDHIYIVHISYSRTRESGCFIRNPDYYALHFIVPNDMKVYMIKVQRFEKKKDKPISFVLVCFMISVAI